VLLSKYVPALTMKAELYCFAVFTLDGMVEVFVTIKALDASYSLTVTESTLPASVPLNRYPVATP
jgi:hypothetical protein